MARRAGHSGVLPLQRVGHSSVFFHAESRGFPPVNRMTGAAFPLIFARRELVPVRVGRMAFGARSECHRLLEIRLRVALRASDLRVLSKQGKFSFRMIELLRRRNLLPSARRMTRLARLRKGAVVGIVVAVRALAKCHPGESGRPTRLGGHMALRASDLRMRAGEREPRLGMVYLGGGFPVNEVVALQTILSELAVMYILVAGHARLRQPEKGPAQVLHLDQGTFRGLDMSRRVTLAALNSRMLSLQLVARLAVIERLEGGLPVDQRKVLAVVLRVAFRAVLLAWESGVQPAVIADFPCDFRVALLALEKRGSPAYRVAGPALCRSADRLMSFRQRPR